MLRNPPQRRVFQSFRVAIQKVGSRVIDYFFLINANINWKQKKHSKVLYYDFWHKYYIPQAAECVQKYLNFSTGTGDKYVHVSRTSFPVLTVCATYPYKMDRLAAHGISYKNKLQLEAHWVSNDSSVSPVQFYEDVVLKVKPHFPKNSRDIVQLLKKTYTNKLRGAVA